MKFLICFLCLIFFSCGNKFSKADQNLLIQDRKNKILEIEYLEEIRIAEKNQDFEAYNFFLKEFLDVPRLNLREELKSHPDYFIGGGKIKY